MAAMAYTRAATPTAVPTPMPTPRATLRRPELGGGSVAGSTMTPVMLGACRYRPRIARPIPIPIPIPILVAVAVALAAVGVFTLTRGNDDDADGDTVDSAEQRAEQLAEAGEDAGLPAEVVALLADAAAGSSSTFQVTYEVADPAGGAPQRVTVTQQPPRRRLDVLRADGSADATIDTGEGVYQCALLEAGWRCDLLREGSATPGLLDPAVIDGLTAALTAAADDYDFTVETRTLLGVEARCLVTTLRDDAPDDPGLGASATMCLSDEGAQLLTEVPSGTLRAIEYRTEIAADAFHLPAEPG